MCSERANNRRSLSGLRSLSGSLSGSGGSQEAAFWTGGAGKAGMKLASSSFLVEVGRLQHIL